MIRGFFRGGTPRLLVMVRMPSLSDAAREVEFLVDTGAVVSVVRTSVLADLGVSPDAFVAMPRESNIGAGGVVMHAVWPGEFEVRHEDGHLDVQTLGLRVPLLPGDEDDLPSVLGMNFLDVYRVVVSVPAGLVALEAPFS